MESAPPSYDMATLTTVWDLVGRYITSSDLCTAALVCHEWNAVFAPHLWGNPASHFGNENDRVYVALTRFKRSLAGARLSVRSLTHTLHLPPAHAELYDGPHASWLREVLDRLPNLQSLIVRALPFFDHAALVALKYTPPPERTQVNSGRSLSQHAVELPAPVTRLPPLSARVRSSALGTFALRLLDASRCTNVTSTGLCQALRRLDSLLYLDLSWTYPARDHAVLDTLRFIPGLQVLKLRGINLRDEDVHVLGHAIGTRVRSLDMRNNHLTDGSVRTLLDVCFTAPNRRDTTSASLNDNRHSPSLLPYLGSDMLATYRGEDFESYIQNAFTTSFVSRLAIEDAPEGGITHLYMSDNPISVDGVAELLQSERLHVLDAGILAQQGLAPRPSKSSVVGSVSGIEVLNPILAQSAAESLTCLRIDHGLITSKLTGMDETSAVPGRMELDSVSTITYLPRTGTVELDTTSAQRQAFELSAEPASPRFELPAEPATPRFELPGNPTDLAISPAMGVAPHVAQWDEDEMAKARRGSVFAPEPLSTLADSPHAMLHPQDAESCVDITHQAPSLAEEQPNTGRARSYSNVAAQRKARTSFHASQAQRFHPSLLPHLTTLVLTSVPPFSTSSETADRLIALSHSCAEEAALARLQARLDWTLPPGRKGLASAITASAKRFFALERIVLEMAPPERPAQRDLGRASAWRHARSMTEDRDSAALWSAAGADFSFFAAGEECGLPSLEPGPSGDVQQGATVLEMQAEMAEGPRGVAAPLDRAVDAEVPRIDNIARLSRFRKDRRAAYEASLAQGCTADADVEGYWPGVVKVVRRNAAAGESVAEDESMDYYGNRFSNGYLYR